MDPEIEIKIMELADKWSDVKLLRRDDEAESFLDKKAKCFDMAYKSIIKTMGYELEEGED